MTLYTVVVCPACQYVRVVPRHPERTSCGRCQTSKRFDSLKHYYQSEDKKAAARVRGAVQARINGMDTEYEDARDRGVIHQEVESVVSDDEYLSGMGADVEEVEQAKERAETATNRSLSKREIMRRAIENHGESRESVFEFTREHDVSDEWVESYLERALKTGEISGSYNGPFRFVGGGR